MKRITFAPGHVVSPAQITLPPEAQDIDIMVSAQIIRIPSALSAHTAAAGGPENCSGGAVDSHSAKAGGPENTSGGAVAAHAHDLVFKANPAADAVTMAADSLRNATAGDLTVHGNGADGGIQNTTPAFTQPTISHANIAAGVADHAFTQPTISHANIVAGIASHSGTDPTVAVSATKDTKRIFHLSVDTQLGDLLIVNYREMGDVVHTS